MKFFQYSILIIFILTFTVQTSAYEEYKIGSAKLSVSSKVRPLEGLIWYPSNDKKEEEILGGNAVWKGFKGLQDANIASGKFPLVIISHGSFGFSQNQAWLATALVQSGYIVATPNHPGTSAFLRDAKDREQLWERPKDTSRTISSMLSSKKFGENIDPSKIFIVGHSLGGFDAMLLMGAKYDKARHDKFCLTKPKSIDCDLFAAWKIARNKADQDKMEADLSDSRISKAIIFDLGGTQSLNKKSLSKIKKSILIIGAGNNSANMNIDDESRALATALSANKPSSKARYLELETLTHFDFLGVCKPAAEAILEKEDPRDKLICKNGGENRAKQHAVIIKQVLDFL